MSASPLPPGSPFLLFVYGSLKRGLRNHHELGPARFVAEARTAPHFALRLLSGYPLLVPGALAVRGELFELPTAQAALLDEFEGPAYERGEIELSDGTLAVAYLATDGTAGQPYTASTWPVPERDG